VSEIIIYQTNDNQTQIQVKFEQETVWLTLNQMAELFGRDKSVVSRHLKNIFKELELNINSVVAKNATTATDGKTYQVEYYNLDAILSVGYRVNSKQGTQFRIWATQRLKDYLVKGYAVNKKRLDELQQTIQLISKGSETGALQLQEAKGLLEIINNYTNSFALLNKFDSNDLTTEKLSKNITYEIKYKEATKAINELKKQLMEKKEAGNLFGNQKDESFQGTLKNITQTFDSDYLYPSIEEQASHLLYFIIKNHPFSDGNKRIGAFMFIWFLEKNKHSIKK
jgi:prophage maintenance system killer protein